MLNGSHMQNDTACARSCQPEMLVDRTAASRFILSAFCQCSSVRPHSRHSEHPIRRHNSPGMSTPPLAKDTVAELLYSGRTPKSV